jgi:hypothetical protein
MTIVPESENIGGLMAVARFSGVLVLGGSPSELRGQHSHSCNYPSAVCRQLSLERTAIFSHDVVYRFLLCCTDFGPGCCT